MDNIYYKYEDSNIINEILSKKNLQDYDLDKLKLIFPDPEDRFKILMSNEELSKNANIRSDIHTICPIGQKYAVISCKESDSTLNELYESFCMYQFMNHCRVITRKILLDGDLSIDKEIFRLIGKKYAKFINADTKKLDDVRQLKYNKIIKLNNIIIDKKLDNLNIKKEKINKNFKVKSDLVTETGKLRDNILYKLKNEMDSELDKHVKDYNRVKTKYTQKIKDDTHDLEKNYKNMINKKEHELFTTLIKVIDEKKNGQVWEIAESYGIRCVDSEQFLNEIKPRFPGL